jgi:hypothetical protein
VVSELGLAPMVLRAALVAEVADGGKLPPPTKAAAMMALLGIALLGMLLVVVVLLGGHWVRRQGAHRRGTAVPRDRRPLLRSDAATPAADGEQVDEGPKVEDAVHEKRSNDGETMTP